MEPTTQIWIVRIVAILAAGAGIFLLKAGNSIGWGLVGLLVILLIYQQVLSNKMKSN